MIYISDMLLEVCKVSGTDGVDIRKGNATLIILMYFRFILIQRLDNRGGSV